MLFVKRCGRPDEGTARHQLDDGSTANTTTMPAVAFLQTRA